MDPPGIRTLVHDKPHNRGTWSPHRHKSWYVMLEMLHYRCLTFYIPKTAKERVSNTTKFLPETLTLPIISSKYAATHPSSDLTHDLLNPTVTSPLTALGYKQTAALKQLAEIFNKYASPQGMTSPRVNYPKATPEAAPAPTHWVDPQGDISFRPGRSLRWSHQHSPHIIPYYIESMPLAAHQKETDTPKVPQEHKYNTRACTRTQV